MTPSAVTGRCSALSSADNADSCSIPETSTRPAPAQRIAWLLASVPPPVKTIPEGSAPISRASCSLASSTRARAARPGAWIDEALAGARIASATASAAPGQTGALAL